MKEKVDVSLDNRQIMSLFIAGLVVLGAVFVIGVVVGKKLASAPRPADPQDLLTALDQKAAQMEQARQDPPLTFQEELTKKSADGVASAPKAEPLKTVTTADVKPAPKVEPKLESAKAETKPAPAVAKSDAAKPTVAVAKAETAPSAKSAVAKLPMDGHVAQTPVPTRTTEKDDLHSAFARIQQATAHTPSGAFAVQVAASQNRSEADAQVARLKAKGYSPYIVSATVPGKGTWYRVRLGSFSSREDASRYLDDFRRETRLDAFVASAH